MVIVLDMFTGSHFPYLLEYFPQLKTQLDGFVYFPNTVSTANATVFTIPSIIGGEYYTIINQNKRRADHEKSERDAYLNTARAFTKAGYEVGFISYPNAASEMMQKTENVFWVDDHRDFYNYFVKKHPGINFDNPHIYDVAHFLSFGLFKFMPDGWMRRSVYRNGLWFFKYRTGTDGHNVTYSVSSFYAFSQIKKANSKKPTFKFIHTDITHAPQAIYAGGGKCNYLKEKTVWDKQELFYPTDLKNFKIPPLYTRHQHFDSEACSLFLLNDFLEWLKEENIYDNTQIFVLSDHAGVDSAFPVPHLLPQDRNQDALFLFKDFEKIGEIKTDSRFMANFDAVTIFCENLKTGCPKVTPNILKNYPENREIIHARNFNIKTTDNTLWPIQRAYKIKGNIYDPAAYTDVSAEYATVGEYAKK